MRSTQGLLYIGIPALMAVLVWYMLKPEPVQHMCRVDLPARRKMCRPKCPKGYFSLDWMASCQPWLSCTDIETNIKIKELLGSGAVKVVYLGQWEDYEIAYSTLKHPAYKDDFKHGLKMLASYQPSPFVTQLIGYCNNAYVTEYHRHGSAGNFLSLIEGEEFRDYNTLQTRFEMCMKYVKIIDFLHSGPLGTRVMCDSNDLEKTLDQYLLTGDLDLVVNDLDALPKVDHTLQQTIKCGHREIYGEFVAPEQLWPHDQLEFLDEVMPGYDEKTDIWKIPAVCDYFLGSASGANNLQFHLFKIHKACKNSVPSQRPNASFILQEYQRIWTKFEL